MKEAYIYCINSNRNNKKQSLKINDTFIKRGRKNKDPFKPEYEENKYIHIEDIKNSYILYTDWEGESPKKWEFSCHWYIFFAFYCDITWSKCKTE